MIKYRFIHLLNAMLCVSIWISCSKDDNETNASNFATGIVELPALRNGANDVFITHSTTFNGQKVTSFSMEYDKSKKHSRWIAFRFDNQTRQQNVSRVTNLLRQTLLSLFSINVLLVILETVLVTIVVIFVLQPIGFIRVR